MRQIRSILCRCLAAVAAALTATAAQAACNSGAYGPGTGDFVVVATVPNVPPPARRYLFRDGRRGTTHDADSPVSCVGDAVEVRAASGVPARWDRIPIIATDTSFTSADTKLAGRLLEPGGSPDPKRPLVVMVHGSEKTAALGDVYALALAAQGVDVFVYDKRGTGASEGDYTQNFELLADDAAAALKQARTMAAGRSGRSGYFGGSQGGWVAPLAATRSPADFVAVGFGLVASPIEEDREQMRAEAEAAHLPPRAIDQIDRLSRATATLVSSHFERGYEALAAIKREIGAAPWAAKIEGEYSGEMLRMRETDLRRIGRARFDNRELIWDYDAVATLRELKVPLLWILAGEDREAPIATTRRALSGLIDAGKPIDLYLFPDTDHGIFEFTTNADGSRTITRIADGYLRLLGDWIKRDAKGSYGRAERLKQ